MFTKTIKNEDTFEEENLVPHLNTFEFLTHNCFNNNFNQTAEVTFDYNKQSIKKFPKLLQLFDNNKILIPQQFVVKGEPENFLTILNSVSSLIPSSSNLNNTELKYALSNSINNDIIINSAVCINRFINPNYLINFNTKKKMYSENLCKTNFQNSTNSASPSVLSLNLAFELKKNNLKKQFDKNYSSKQKNLSLLNESLKKKNVIKFLSSSIEKRNARERKRVHTVNQAFYLLKNKLPSICRNTKRVSKLKILTTAINYIYSLKNIILFQV